MNLGNSFKSAAKALMRNKMRSSLTSIGIVIGVSSVIMMVGLGSSAKLAVRERIATFGNNGLSVSFKTRRIFEKEYIKIKKQFPEFKYITPVMREKHIPVRYLNIASEALLCCVNNDYFYMREWALERGRYFFDNEIQSSECVTIIGSTVMRKFFGYYNPLGKTITINGIPYKVIGVLTETGSSFSGMDFDDTVIIPYTTGMIRFAGSRSVDEIYASGQSDDNLDPMVTAVTTFLRSEHNLTSGMDDDFVVVTSKDKLKMADNISQMLSSLLAGVASISLIVGGVGIMNIMLVSVSERTREIGIRMAIGAKKRDILLQFLIESMTLSTLGGFIGIALGLIGYYAIVSALGWSFIFSIASIFISFIFSSGVGIFFGFYPAKKASALKPIEALRYE
jgi:putative ABC transport system permease protein